MMPWSRPQFEPGGPPAVVATAAFFTGPPPDGLSLDASQGVPASVLELARIQALQRGAAPDAFRRWLGPASLERAEARLGRAAAGALARAGGAVVLQLDRPDPPDLQHLNLQWQLRAALAQAGAVAHLDLVTGAWLPTDMAPQTFDVALEIATIFHSAPSPGYGHVAMTRGLCKVGRPELLIIAPTRSSSAFCHRLLRAIARALADGAPIGPGSLFNDGAGARFRAVTAHAGQNVPPGTATPGALLLERISNDPNEAPERP